MNNQWQSSQFPQDLPSQNGQVKMFNPTHFQTSQVFEGAHIKSVPQPPPQQQQQLEPNSDFPHPHLSAETATSWNSWSTWDWNPENNNPHGQGKGDHSQQGLDINAVSQTQQFVGGVSDGGYYGSDHYSTGWNHGWGGADQYVHSQGYTQPDQGQQQFAGLMFGQDQVADDLSSQQQHNLQNQYYDGQFYDHHQQEQQLVEDKEQIGNHEQYSGQFDYDPPSGPGEWPAIAKNGHWVSDYPNQHFSNQTAENADIDGQPQLSISQMTPVESIPQNTQESITPASIGSNIDHESVTLGPRLEVYDHDDDGTVSGYFGRDGDEDGNVQLDSQRNTNSGDNYSQNEVSSVSNQFLKVAPSFHRTNSEISNASLSTLNLSLGDDDDVQEPLHNIQALVQRMEEVDVHGVNFEQNNKQVHSAQEDKTSTEQLHIGAASDLTKDSVSEHGHKQGDYSGFGNAALAHGHLSNSLPFDNSVGVASMDNNQPGSAESGESGGSSGLADWEIVPPSTTLVSSGNILLDSNAGPYSKKPDGGMYISSGLEKLHHVDTSQKQTPVQSVIVSSDHSIHDAFQNPDLPNSSLHDNTSLSLPPHSESLQAYLDSRGHSGSPYVAAITDHKEEKSSALKTQASAQVSTTTSPEVDLNIGQLTEDGSDNCFGRENVKSLRHSEISSSSIEVPSSLSQLSTLQNIQPSAKKASVSTQQSLDARKAQELASLPTKNKVQSNTLIEDGSRINKRDLEHNIKPVSTSSAHSIKSLGTSSAHSIKSVGTSSTHSRDSEEPPIRSSSRNSEDVSATSQQRHSAFHPVGRPWQTAHSSTTMLWDSSETPTSNILLAPAVPLIIPNLNPSPFPASTISSASKMGTLTAERDGAAIENDSSRSGPDSITDLSIDSRDNERKGERYRNLESRKKYDKNRSQDSLDEIDAVVERQRDRSYYSQHLDSRDTSFNQDSSRRESFRRDSDRPLSRSDRPMSRSGHYHYERPLSRTEGYSREELYRRNRGIYRDYGDSSFDERYDRPRSRPDESQHPNSRPSSRSGQEVDKPRTRGFYERDRDYYYNRDRHRGYGYDNYGRQVDYYQDERERYYRYYRDKEAHYTRGYYEEYYGAKHADYYYQQQKLQQQQQQEGRRNSSHESDQSGSRSQSRGSTPATAPSPAPPPAIKTGPDYYGNRSSRPDSRTDYSRDYYGRHYGDESYNPYYSNYGYDPYAFAYNYPTYDEYAQGYYQGRLTPPKYSYPHVRACFGPTGQLIKVLPNRPADGQPAVIEVQDVQTILESCPEADELKQFPGPLTREHTHKKDVLLFCQLKARACAEDINMVDRESAQLIWRFLELLIKQNGAVVGTDLSDLLLEGHEPSTHEYSLHGVRISQSPEVLDTVPEGNSEGSNSTRASPAVRVTSDRTVINTADREREKWIDRFRNLLLYGRKKDALECAMKHNLWGHALFLASKMDARTHANVMTRFANGAIRMNDPLQTLYQLMSGRQPAAVTCVVDERWGDWRPHLAMILSNQTSKQDIDRKSITTLGDTLAARGCLHASHFCYLMAQVSFGSYCKKTSKIVLVGSNHNLPLEEFATNEAIQCTEVYEYAQTLANPAFCLPHFQIFKYLYACQLADYGMSLEALQYCELIANNIQQYPAWFQSPFVRLVLQLSTRLQFSDPQRQVAGEDAQDPVWLQQLGKLCASYDDGSIQSFSGSVTPALLPGTTTSSESGDYSTYGYGYVGDTSAVNSTPGAPGIDIYRNQQQQLQEDMTDHNSGHDLSAITGQVQSLNIAANIDQHQPQIQQQQEQLQHQQEQGDYSQQVDSSHQQYDYSYWQQQQQHHSHGHEYQQQQQQREEGEHYQQQQPPQLSHPQQPMSYQSATAVAAADDGSGYVYDSNSVPDNTSHPGGLQLDSSSASQTASQLHSPEYGYYEQGHQQQYHQPHRASINASDTYDDDNDDDEDDDDVNNGTANGFDYFGDVGSQIVAPPHRYRHMSGSSTGSTRRRRTASGSSTGSVKAAPHKPPPQQPYSMDSGKGGDNKQMKPGPQDTAGGGWFGGFLNKFKVKGKNEMILPDDKNPAIVWDPVKKKWTNADGTEEEETQAAPPPKDTDLLSKSTCIIPNPSGPPPPTGIPGGNRFSLKAKGARNQYVDVTNPKSVSVPHNLFSVMPANNNSTAAPTVFLPGQASLAAGRDINSGNVDNSGLTAAATTDKPNTATANTTDPTPTTPSMPLLFNPASVKSTSGGKGQTSSSAAGPGLRTGQRRAYPK